MAEKKNNNRKITVRFNIMWFWSIIALLIIGTWIFGTENTEPVKSNWNTVETMIRNGEVDKIVVVNGELAEVYLRAVLGRPGRNHPHAHMYRPCAFFRCGHRRSAYLLQEALSWCCKARR